MRHWGIEIFSLDTVQISGRFFFSSRRRHTRLQGDWSSDVCSSDLRIREEQGGEAAAGDLALELVEPEVVALRPIEQDRNRGEQLEDVEQLFVRGVVRDRKSVV